MGIDVHYFASPPAMRAWLRKNHAKASELHVGYFKKHTGTPSITWPQSVAEALCYGWIDGIRRRLDDDRYVIRFTPRRPTSTWSAVNIQTVRDLDAAGRMAPAGRAAFERRLKHKTKAYTYEQKDARLDADLLGRFKKHKSAWAFFESQPPSYRKKATWWVTSAKGQDTRERRFARLLESCAAGRR